MLKTVKQKPGRAPCTGRKADLAVYPLSLTHTGESRQRAAPHEAVRLTFLRLGRMRRRGFPFRALSGVSENRDQIKRTFPRH